MAKHEFVQWLVWDMTNYGSGYIMAGVYESLDEAKKRLEYCKKMVPDDDVEGGITDSWMITPVYRLRVNDDSVFDAL